MSSHIIKQKTSNTPVTKQEAIQSTILELQKPLYKVLNCHNVAMGPSGYGHNTTVNVL